MLTLVRSDISVPVLRAVRCQLLHPPGRPVPARNDRQSSGGRTASTCNTQIRLLKAWLSHSGSLDVLHVRYEWAGSAEPLEYRVEMDLQVEALPGSRAFARAADVEARQIVEEIRGVDGASLQAVLVRVDGHLCWGAV